MMITLKAWLCCVRSWHAISISSPAWLASSCCNCMTHIITPLPATDTGGNISTIADIISHTKLFTIHVRRYLVCRIAPLSFTTSPPTYRSCHANTERPQLIIAQEHALCHFTHNETAWESFAFHSLNNCLLYTMQTGVLVTCQTKLSYNDCMAADARMKLPYAATFFCCTAAKLTRQHPADSPSANNCPRSLTASIAAMLVLRFVAYEHLS